ncbi:stage II sporulation protein M [bacterium]|nr:MAG: stage II sporulation protein M [bacterium]
MNEEAFVRRREKEWQRLALLCAKADSNPRSLSPAEFDELVRRYRSASSDLSHARTFGHHPPLIDSLNDLVGRAYSVLYRRPRRPAGALLVAALVRAAQTVRRRRAFVLASLMLLLGSAFFSYFVAGKNTDFREAIVPAQMGDVFEGWKKGQFPGRTGGENGMMTAVYMTNNPRVSIIAGAVGAASFGLLSATMMAHNGAMVGVLASEMSKVHKLPFLLVSILPHGITEMSGAAIAAAGGLLLGWALIDPGRRSRADSLRAAGPDAGILLLIGVALTLMAAPIEGFFSFNPDIPDAARLGVIVVTFLGWLAFWSGFGRTPDEEA